MLRDQYALLRRYEKEIHEQRIHLFDQEFQSLLDLLVESTGFMAVAHIYIAITLLLSKTYTEETYWVKNDITYSCECNHQDFREDRLQGSAHLVLL